VTEHDAELLLASLLRHDADEVCRQVPLGGKVIDLVVDWCRDDGVGESMETIEVKLHDWRRGAKQAYVSGAYVGLASIAMPANARRRVDEAYLRKLGVGLIEFDANGWWRVIEPVESKADPEVLGHLRLGLALRR
jgi:hypothetical protein